MVKQDCLQNLCANVRYLRKHRGLSRTSMAKKLCISLSTLNSLESGVVPAQCSVALLYNISDTFGVPVHQCIKTRMDGESV